MGRVGLEPTREVIPMVFETIASTDSATSPVESRLKRRDILALPMENVNYG